MKKYGRQIPGYPWPVIESRLSENDDRWLSVDCSSFLKGRTPTSFNVVAETSDLNISFPTLDQEKIRFLANGNVGVQTFVITVEVDSETIERHLGVEIDKKM